VFNDYAKTLGLDVERFKKIWMARQSEPGSARCYWFYLVLA